MKYLAQTLAATGLALSMGTMAFAQDADPATMTCAQFAALGSEDQKAAVDALRAAKMEAGGAASTDATGTASPDATGETTGTASTDTSADATADPAVTALTEACAGNDDDLAMDYVTAQ